MKHRALLLDDAGVQWLNNIDQQLGMLAKRWDITLGAQLSGGTEALVFAATGSTGACVLKIGLPHSLSREIETLQRSNERAYATLLAADKSQDAILMESLGSQLAEAPLNPEQQIDILCSTLKLAWQPLESAGGLQTAAEKAIGQADYISHQYEALGQPCSRAIVDQAISFTDERLAAYNPQDSYLIHGDAHIWNTLAALDSPTGYKFVDPDGLHGERAIDLAISLREWRDELLAGNTLELGLQRCALLSKLTGVDQQSIWQWGFIEHVSCGLLDLNLGDQDAAAKHFNIATCWIQA